MIPKKVKKADLENKRVIFFRIGLLVSLAIALLAFEWAAGEPKKIMIPDTGVDPLLDNEVVKALKASPRWKPGKQRDIPVEVIFTIPVVFKINY
ncbi:MAG TPA: energy transducer TonB [Bacteroidales bacterium]|nr:energy transducer TonB [Bacteroidales bacterium]